MEPHLNPTQPGMQLPQSTSTSSLDPVHERAAIVARDILSQIGINDAFVRRIVGLVSMVNMLPGFGPLAQIQQMTGQIQPMLDKIAEDPNVETYIRQLPPDQVKYFLNMVIARLEWVINGNDRSNQDASEGQGSHREESTITTIAQGSEGGISVE